MFSHTGRQAVYRLPSTQRHDKLFNDGMGRHESAAACAVTVHDGRTGSLGRHKSDEVEGV
jgi:hypothetical protein